MQCVELWCLIRRGASCPLNTARRRGKTRAKKKIRMTASFRLAFLSRPRDEPPRARRMSPRILFPLPFFPRGEFTKRTFLSLISPIKTKLPTRCSISVCFEFPPAPRSRALRCPLRFNLFRHSTHICTNNAGASEVSR